MNNLKNISILHINTAMTWRGGEKQTFLLTKSLHEKGYRSYCVCQKGSALQKKLAKENLLYFPADFRIKLNIFTAKRIAEFASEVNAKIIHMHTSHAHSFGFLIKLFYKSCKFIVSRRVDFSTGKNPFSRLKYKFPDRYITVSGAIRDILIKDGIRAEKISVAHSGIELNDYKNIKADYLYDEFGKLPDINKKLKLVNVAALTEQKDHETLLKAAALLKRKNSNFILLIAGEGELEKKLKNICLELSLEKNVLFTGFRKDPLNLISFGDIFIMSSRWEGLGTSIIDAMALKKPVIATETGGIPELIRNNENGILVQKENPEALADAITVLINDRLLREKLSKRALLTAGNFVIENTVLKTIKIYSELCG